MSDKSQQAKENLGAVGAHAKAVKENMEAAASNGAAAAEAAAPSINADFNLRITQGISRVTRTSWRVGWGLVAVGVAGDFAILATRQLHKAWKSK